MSLVDVNTYIVTVHHETDRQGECPADCLLVPGERLSDCQLVIVQVGFLGSPHELESFGRRFENVDTLMGGGDCGHVVQTDSGRVRDRRRGLVEENKCPLGPRLYMSSRCFRPEVFMCICTMQPLVNDLGLYFGRRMKGRENR